MEVLRTKNELWSWIGARGGRPRSLVPTMGALHRGHASLFDLAREKNPSGDVIATIFVNPTQFGPNEDFAAYPRPLDADLAISEKHEVDAVFAPADGEMYAPDASISIHENRLSTGLCGASRPTHFDGVCTVVTKLFNLIQPHSAVFGEKDFQQLAVIRRLVRDLDMPVDILGAPTVREGDGLALSSRNDYLSSEQRAEAPIIYRALSRVAKEIADREWKSPSEARASISEEIGAAAESRIDYVAIVDSETLEPLDEFSSATPRLLAAVYFGKTRLIDNVGIPADV